MASNSPYSAALGSSSRQYSLISTSSDACLLLIAGWLNICVSEHLLCHQVTSLPGALPTRLVDVGPLYGCLPPFFSISYKNIENTVYLALSHCWGAAKLLQLKGSNFDYLRRCINNEWSSAHVSARCLHYQTTRLSLSLDCLALYPSRPST